MPRPTARTRLLAATAVALVSLAAASGARGDVDLELGNGNRVQGSLSPASEVETLRFAPAPGATVTVTAAGAKRGPAVSAALTPPQGGSPAAAVEGARNAKLRFVADAEGAWEVGVRSRDGTTSGEYTATVKWKSPRKFGPLSATLEPGGGTPFAFAADAGARVKIVARAARGSAALPRIAQVSGPGGDLGGAVDGAGGRTDTAGPFVVPATGRYSVVVDDSGSGGGDVSVTVTVTPPKAAKRTLDVRSATVGGGDAEGAVARVVGAEGGLVLVDDDALGLGSIAGASIDVPAGVLPAGVALVIGTASDFDVPDVDETSLGAAVFFGPEGTTFGSKSDPKSVTLTIPLDLGAVGGDTSKVEVWVRDARGRVSQVAPPYDFSVAGYVSFPTSHFSSYRALARDVAPPPTPVTLASGLSWLDLEQAPNVTGALAGQPIGTQVAAITADGPDGTVSYYLVSPSGQPQRVVYAGGGTMTSDGSGRLQFDFQGAVRSVFNIPDGRVYVGTATRIFRIDTTGLVTRIAGTGVAGDAGDNGPATAGQFQSCRDMVVSLTGDVFFCDSVSGRIRQVMVSSGNILTFAGDGTTNFGSDGGTLPFGTSFAALRAVEFHSNGGLLVADGGRLRRMDLGQQVNTTVAGDASGLTGSSGDGGAPTSARFRSIATVRGDATPGSYVVCDTDAHTIRRVDLNSGNVEALLGIADVDAISPDGSAGPYTLSFPFAAIRSPGFLMWLDDDGARVRGIRNAAP